MYLIFSLQILPPDKLSRVSEYIPDIIAYIETIIKNGYAYESNGSVYFDVVAFDSKPIHHYAKLVPEAYGDTKSLQDGEGNQSVIYFTSISILWNTYLFIIMTNVKNQFHNYLHYIFKNIDECKIVFSIL
jgi:cysteinyl-tRNA synthetase